MTMSTSEVKVIKLVGGMEVVGKVPIEQFSDPATAGAFLTIQNPHYVVPQNHGGQMGITLQPFSLVADISAVDIPAQHILCMLQPDDRFAQSYLAAQAGLVTADAGDVPAEGARSDRRGKLTLVD